MDVNTQAVADTFKGKWPDGYYVGRSDVILHGHTHRCAIHLQADTPAAKITESTTQSKQGTLSSGLRIVLPDWNFDEPEKNRPKGGFLKLEPSGHYTLNLFN